MKHIAIATLNSKYVHASLSPWCLLAGLREFSTLETVGQVLETTINQDLDLMVEKVLQGDFHMVGFSCYIWNITQTLEVTRRIKEKSPLLPIILGGPEVSFNQEDVLQSAPWIDFILSGEGEETFPKLIDTYFKQEDLSQVHGLTYRESGHIRTNPPHIPCKHPPSPYCEAYFTQLEGKISYMESSRGCPYSCAFCLSGEGQGVRYFQMSRVKEEILLLANSGTKTVKFIDRTFNSSVTHANEILQFILDEYGNKIPSHICFHFELAGDILRPSTLQLIEKMPKGYIQLEIGMQSFSEKTLEAVHRKTNIPLLCENIQSLVSFGNHHLHIDLIAGLPEETLEIFQESFHIAYELKASMLQLGFLKVLQGSHIGNNPDKFPCEYDKMPPYQVISTPWLSKEDIFILEQVEDSVDRLYNSGRFTLTLDYVLSVCGLRPYDLMAYTGKTLCFTTSPSLDEYIDAIFRIFSQLPHVDGQILRDFLVLDRVETNSTGNLPKSLMIQDPMLRKLKIFLENGEDTATPKGGKRFVGILYGRNQGVYVDYPEKSQSKQHFFQRYVSHFVDLSPLLCEEESSQPT